MISRRDRAEFDAFVRRSGDRLVRTAYLLCGDHGHAEDLTQTALMRTARHWRTAHSNPDAYARQVVANLVKDHWRGRGRRPSEAPLDTGPEPAARNGTDAVLDRDVLVRAARRLPPGQRAVVVLRFFDDLSVEDTAAALGCSTGTVKSQTKRALDSLRAVLDTTQEPARVD
ncbi:SigE family RNA polymerase sigma factor [Jatrophihabitans fulvus]